MASQRCKVPISIVAVNCIEAIDHIEWLHNDFSVYGRIFEPLISSHASTSTSVLGRPFGIKPSGANISVANAAVYPPNWATLKSSAAGQKTVRWVA